MEGRKKAMEKTNNNATRFIYSGIIAITDNNDRTLVVDTMHNTIECSTKSGINPIMNLTVNNTDIIRLNKTTVSYYNLDMLVYLLQHNQNAFNAAYAKIYGIIPVNNEFKYHVTKSQFYNSFNNDIPAFIDFFTSCSSETKQVIIADHITYDHDAKMNGIISLSTYVGYNRFCQSRCNNCDNAICQYCYAASLTDMRHGLKNKLIRLHAIFTFCELTKYDIPVLDNTIYPYFRFESFGDLNNTIQINNYNLFASVNPSINFTLWTKNPGIIQQAINAGMILSNNLVIGLSSLYLNTPELEKAQKYPFIRFLFTVYDDEYIKKHNIIINCGAKHCITCGICYKYLHEFKHGLQLINERKK